MLGKGRYSWFHNLKKRPIKLVERGSKKEFYAKLHQKTVNAVYPKPTVFKRVIKKLKRELGLLK